MMFYGVNQEQKCAAKIANYAEFAKFLTKKHVFSKKVSE